MKTEICLYCDKKTAVYKDRLAFKGLIEREVVSYKAPGWSCSSCGESWTSGEDLKLHDARKADAYRGKHGLLEASELEKQRGSLSFNKSQFAAYLEIPRMTYDRWLKGIVQGKTMDNALRAKLEPRTAAVNNLRFRSWEFRACKAEFRGNREPDYEKLFALIRAFLERRGAAQIGALYLNKLCWYADQQSYNRFGQSITGIPYVALDHGPVIKHYDEVFRSMRLCGLIEENAINDFAVGTNKDFTLGLEERDSEIVDEVWKKLGKRLTRLRNYSHDESGWTKTESFEMISFELSKELKALLNR